MIEIKNNDSFNKVDEIKVVDTFESDHRAVFKGSGEDLKNYRIYGNTVSGESVGDRTINLFDKNHPNVSIGAFDANGFQFGWINDAFIYIECESNTTYTVSKGLQPTSGSNRIAVCTTTEIPNSNSNVYDYKSLQAGMPYTEITITTGSNAAYLCAFVYHKDEEMPINEMLETIQIEKMASASSYEPYGYRVPITVEGKNLFDKNNPNVFFGYFNSYRYNSSSNDRTIYIHCLPNTTYTVTKHKQKTKSSNRLRLCTTIEIPTENSIINDYIAYPDGTEETKLTITTGANAAYLCCFIYSKDNNTSFESLLETIQIEKGFTATSYEPYQAPVTTNLYLPERIKMVGNEAEYVDYKEQKQHFADGTSIDIELPALPTVAGTNTLSVGTEVQPSDVYVQGKIKNN